MRVRIPPRAPLEPTRLGDVLCLEPYPDSFLRGATDALLGPDGRYERSESISLAFVIALRREPRQPERSAANRGIVHRSSSATSRAKSCMDRITAA